MSVLEIEKTGRTTIFTFNRQDNRNSINVEVAEKLFAGFKEFDASDQRVAIITGNGDLFSAGADLADLPALWKALPTLGICTEKPIICAVNGDCIGGAFMISVLSDLCVASENAHFHYPEARVGVTGGVAAALASRIPYKLAMEILLMAEPVKAQRAYEMGLVNKVVPQGEALSSALEMARELERMAPLVLTTLKRFIVQTLPVSPAEQSGRAQRDLEIIRASEDRAKGVKAFLEGGEATYEGR